MISSGRTGKFVDHLARHYLDGKQTTFRNGQPGYHFPCPFCSHIQEKESKRKEKWAKLVLDKRWNSYNFFCHRKGHSDCQGVNNISGGLSLKTFLKRFNQDLYELYVNQSSGGDFDFQPKWRR